MKRLLIIILVISAVFALTNCAGGKNSDGENSVSGGFSDTVSDEQSSEEENSSDGSISDSGESDSDKSDLWIGPVPSPKD